MHWSGSPQRRVVVVVAGLTHIVTTPYEHRHQCSPCDSHQTEQGAVVPGTATCLYIFKVVVGALPAVSAHAAKESYKHTMRR